MKKNLIDTSLILFTLALIVASAGTIVFYGRFAPVQSLTFTQLFYLGLFVGIISAFLLINLFSLIFIRNTSFIFYAYYVSSISIMCISNASLPFFEFSSILIESATRWLVFTTAFLLVLFFAKQTLLIKLKLHVRNVISIIAALIVICIALLGWTTQMPLFGFFARGFQLIIPLVLLGFSIIVYIQGHHEIRFSIPAWAVLTIFRIPLILVQQEDSTQNILYMMGITLHLLFITCSLFDVIRKELFEKNQTEAREKYYQQLSRTDTLTGLYNRRYLNEIVTRLKNDNEMPADSALIMIDLDNFKIINDTFGHLSGDMILSKTGTIIKKHIRKTDIACRYGGDEFLVFLPGANIDAATIIAKAIHATLKAEIMYADDGSQLSITTSIGISENRLEDTFDGLFLRADAALYQAKKTGRDKIMFL